MSKSKSPNKRINKTISGIDLSYVVGNFESRWEKIVSEEVSKILGRNINTIWSQVKLDNVSGRFDIGFSFGSVRPTIVIIEYDGEQHFRGPGLDESREKDIQKQNGALDAGVFFIRIDYNQGREGINSCIKNAMINLRITRKMSTKCKSRNIYYSNPELYRWISDAKSSKISCSLQ